MKFPKTLLQAFLYIHSLMRKVTYRVFLLSICTLNPTIMPLLEPFVEVIFQINVQHYHHIVLNIFIFLNLLLQGGLQFWNEHKVTQSQIWCIRDVSQFIGDACTINCLTDIFGGCSIVMLEVQLLNQNSGLSFCSALCNSFAVAT